MEGFVCDDGMGRWFCKTPVPLAENLRLLRRRWEVGRDCGWRVGGSDRCALVRNSVEVIIEAFLPSTLSRGYKVGL